MYSEHVRVLCNLMSAFIIMRTELATEIKGHAYYSPTVTSLEKPKCTKASDLLYDALTSFLSKCPRYFNYTHTVFMHELLHAAS